jgi:hypothetical protein
LIRGAFDFLQLLISIGLEKVPSTSAILAILEPDRVRGGLERTSSLSSIVGDGIDGVMDGATDGVVEGIMM